MPPSVSRLALIDGSDLARRAWDALPSTLRDRDGASANVLHGFARMFRQVLIGRHPSHGVVVLSSAPPVRADAFLLQWQQIPVLVESIGWSTLVGDPVQLATGWCARHRATDILLVGTDPHWFGLLDERTRVLDAVREIRYDADRARRTARVRRDPPPPSDVPTLDAYALTPPDADAHRALYERLDLADLLHPTPMELVAYVLDSPAAVFAALADTCCTTAPVAVLPLLDPTDHRLLGVGLAPTSGTAFWVPGRFASHLQGWLMEPTLPKIVHDARTVHLLWPDVRGIVLDTQTASFRLDPTRCLPHTLDQVSRHRLGRALPPLPRGIRHRRSPLFACTDDALGAWGTHLVAALAALGTRMETALVIAGQLSQHAHDLALAPVLARMQQQGIALDPKPLHELDQVLTDRANTLLTRLHELAGRSFEPGSPKQLAAILFDELGLPVQRHTRTGRSTDRNTLNALRPLHPLIDVLFEWRHAAGQRSRTTSVLLRHRNPTTGRLHPRWEATVSASGRILSTEPDVQRTPLATDADATIRSAFRAPDGRTLVVADWSQIELRVLAHLSQDAALLKAFRSGQDLHALTADGLFGSHDPPHRSVGKAVNFATVYGQGARALAEQIDCSYAEAKAFIEGFFDLYPGVVRWRAKTIARAHIDGFVRTLGGRKRTLPELSTRAASDRAHGERVAVNMPVQGSVVDLLRTAMVRVDNDLRSLDAHLVLQVHDELVVEVAQSGAHAAAEVVRAAMANAADLLVPLEVDLDIRSTWGCSEPAR